MEDKKKGDKSRWQTAPRCLNWAGLGTGQLNGIKLAPDEEVEWVWYHTAKGSWVIGYKVAKKLSHTYFSDTKGNA